MSKNNGRIFRCNQKLNRALNKLEPGLGKLTNKILKTYVFGETGHFSGDEEQVLHRLFKLGL